MTGIYVIATAHIRAEMVTTFVTSAKLCIAATRHEAGHVRYDGYASLTEPNRFVFVEEWASREALEAHFAARHTAAFLAIVAECVAEPPTIEIVTPQAVSRR